MSHNRIWRLYIQTMILEFHIFCPKYIVYVCIPNTPVYTSHSRLIVNSECVKQSFYVCISCSYWDASVSMCSKVVAAKIGDCRSEGTANVDLLPKSFFWLFLYAYMLCNNSLRMDPVRVHGFYALKNFKFNLVALWANPWPNSCFFFQSREIHLNVFFLKSNGW